MSQPSTDTLVMLESLRRAVAQALEKKRRLGQYAVVWENDRPTFIGGNGPSDFSPTDSAESPPAGS